MLNFVFVVGDFFCNHDKANARSDKHSLSDYRNKENRIKAASYKEYKYYEMH